MTLTPRKRALYPSLVFLVFAALLVGLCRASRGQGDADLEAPGLPPYFTTLAGGAATLFENVRIFDGKSAALSAPSNVLVRGKTAHILRIDPEAKAKPLLKVEPMVIARLMECQPDWCRIQVSGRKGWIEKQYLWGVYAKEVFE